MVAEALRDAGMQVMTHGEIFAPDAPDQDWLSFAGEREYIVLTKDRRIRRKPLEIEAIKRARWGSRERGASLAVEMGGPTRVSR